MIQKENHFFDPTEELADRMFKNKNREFSEFGFNAMDNLNKSKRRIVLYDFSSFRMSLKRIFGLGEQLNLFT